jgi:hypothetical protein
VSISKLTKEWLQNVISGLEDLRDPMLAFLDDDQAKTYEAMKLALEALDGKTVADHAQKELERLRAQTPVGWTDEQELRDVERGGCGYLFKADPITPHADMRRVILLYAEPKPLADDISDDVRAVVQLLSEGEWAEHCTKTDLGQQLEAEVTKLVGYAVPVVPDEKWINPDIHYADENGFAEGWNACRAAMLQSGNSPVIPDGWVPCSERMPENDESKPIAIFTGKCLGQGMFVATYEDDGFFDFWEGMEIIGVTHWMPLPAAPEVK